MRFKEREQRGRVQRKFTILREQESLSEQIADRALHVRVFRLQTVGDRRRFHRENEVVRADIVEKRGLLGIDIGNVFIRERDFQRIFERLVFVHERGFDLCGFRPQRGRTDLRGKSPSVLLGNENFTGAGQRNGLDVFRLSLRHQVKIADLVDLVAEEFHTHRCVQMGRIDVDDTAANAEFALTVHEVGANIARIHEEFREIGKLHAVTDRKVLRRTAEHLLRNGERERRRGRCDHTVELAVEHIRQHGNALVLQLVRGYHIVENGVSLGIDRRARAERRQRAEQASRRFFVRNADKGEGRTKFLLRNRGGEENVKRALAKPRHHERPRLRTAVLAPQIFYDFTVFTILSDTVRKKLHLGYFLLSVRRAHIQNEKSSSINWDL